MNPIQPRNSSLTKNVFNEPPKRGVRALTTCQDKRAWGLSYRQGDYFYALDQDDKLQVIEVINPISKIRGFVPMEDFEYFDKDSSYRKTIQGEPSAVAPIYSTLSKFSVCSEPAAHVARKLSSFCLLFAHVFACQDQTIELDVQIKGMDPLWITRSFTELWNFHVTLLTLYPIEAGRKSCFNTFRLIKRSIDSVFG